MEFNLADLFESSVDAFPDREYLVAEGKRRTYAQMDERANRLAHHLRAQGVRPGDHVGIYAYNSVEWVEALWAIFKLRAVWININYRYVEDELRYLFDNADLVGLIYAREFAPRIAGVRDALPKLRFSLVIEDGSGADCASLGSQEYEPALASGAKERDFAKRSGGDRYILYTGGTTGLPKGVVWRHEDVFFALGGGVDPLTGKRAERPEEMAERGKAGGVTFLPIAPLMHGATQWAVMGGSFIGRRNVLVAKFDPKRVWRLVEQERVNGLMITGDAMARPLIEALDEPGASYDLSSLVVLSSSAAVFSPSLKDDFFRHFPNLIMTDAVGASESGTNGILMVKKGSTAMRGGGPTVRAVAETVVLDENLEPVQPGSGVVGRVACGGNIPLEYYKDPEKTRQTFVTDTRGRRYSIPGDFATVEPDGSITLLGRGSVSINSGGEKIYPEEVESAIKSHPDCWDAIVVGVPDERFGSRVAAVVQAREGRAPTLDSIQAHCRTRIAGYKVPRELHLVAKVERSPSGKPDYRWAKAVATGVAREP
ncbi:MAG: acyl-CoA synthetase [Deltaproteobacteria bacterium]|nr:acyl-CoA synthetase [Deltaproteobacteria bacterium]